MTYHLYTHPDVDTGETYGLENHIVMSLSSLFYILRRSKKVSVYRNRPGYLNLVNEMYVKFSPLSKTNIELI